MKDSIRKDLEEERLADPSFGQKLLQDELKKADIKINDSDLKDTFSHLLGKRTKIKHDLIFQIRSCFFFRLL